MHIVVCIKQVPDSTQIRVHPVTNTIMRQGVPTIINPYDLFALEEALRLRDLFALEEARWLRDPSRGKVTVVTMGPPMAAQALRKALTYGADRAVLVTDRRFAGSDTLATSFALSCAIAKIGERFGPPDIIFTGKQTIDGDTAQVGPGIAKRLNIQQLTYIKRVTRIDHLRRSIDVERCLEGGTQFIESKMPCLITMLDGLNTIRRGSIDDSLRAARSSILTWGVADLGVRDVDKFGLKGSPTVVKRVFAPAPRAQKSVQLGTANKTVRHVADELVAWISSHQPKLADGPLSKSGA
ncbi:electron transfer flavoprotein subunit beta/FixA family protein [Neorhizobium galegae]|uniref:Protein FixA n=1 Tax=Neorhizobium galegae TaxID=399 RepID=A0A6A1THR2_NEOGA|nr:electron transfer flavoprotein subunit beta/FixA family protein [Neorhizobium galegae]KAB1083543.1 electron transfer flavoprotein subunit beta/FixA family protein [Neorhizobium galegae]